jgi:stage II sporulation protein D
MQEAATGRVIELPVDQRAQIAASDYRVWTSNRWWRGALEIMAVRNSMTVVNYLDLEDYLQGVVPSEMPSSWQIEALKAQAVAARSYAWAHMGPGRSKWFSNEGYDLVPDVRDQAYKGLAAEAPSTRMAVWATHGIILSDSGKVKAGFYRAWVGENPETNLNIRRKDVPNALLEKITGVPQILGVTVKQYDGLFNAHSVAVMGAKKTREVSGVALAKMLNFSTAGILDIRQNGNNWLFTFRGPGNGALGLSQNGANMLAKNGWKFDQILQQYYQDPDGKLRFDSTDRQLYSMQQHMVPAAATAEEAN